MKDYFKVLGACLLLLSILALGLCSLVSPSFQAALVGHFK